MICCSGASDISVSDIDRSSVSWSCCGVELLLLLNGDGLLNVEVFEKGEDDVVGWLKCDVLLLGVLLENWKEDIIEAWLPVAAFLSLARSLVVGVPRAFEKNLLSSLETHSMPQYRGIQQQCTRQ